MIDTLVSAKLSRSILFIAFLIGALLLPAWMVLAMAALVALFVPMYVEFIIIIVVIEALYRGVAPFSTGVWLPVAAILLFIAFEASRDYLSERVLRL